MKNTIEKIKKDIEMLSSITCVNAAKAEMDKIFAVALENPLIAAAEAVVANPTDEGVFDLLCMLASCDDEAFYTMRDRALEMQRHHKPGRYDCTYPCDHIPDFHVGGYGLSVGHAEWCIYDLEDWQEYPCEAYRRLASGRINAMKLWRAVQGTLSSDKLMTGGEGWCLK